MSEYYYIGWRARATGETGHDTAKFPFPVAQQLAEDLNRSEAGKLCYHYPVPTDEGEEVEP